MAINSINLSYPSLDRSPDSNWDHHFRTLPSFLTSLSVCNQKYTHSFRDLPPSLRRLSVSCRGNFTHLTFLSQLKFYYVKMTDILNILGVSIKCVDCKEVKFSNAFSIPLVFLKKDKIELTKSKPPCMILWVEVNKLSTGYRVPNNINIILKDSDEDDTIVM